MLTASEGTVRLWEVESGRLLIILGLKDHSDGVQDAVLSHDGTKVLASSIYNMAQLWEVANGKELVTLQMPDDSGHVTDVVLSLDGTRALTFSEDDTVRLWEVANGKELATLRLPGSSNKPAPRAAFSSDCAKVLTVSAHGKAQLWETASGNFNLLTTWELEGYPDWRMRVEFSPDARLVTTINRQRQVSFWKVNGLERGSLLGLYATSYEVLVGQPTIE